MTDVDLVIFDKDGTLIDIHYYWGGMLKLRANYIVQKYINKSNKTKVFDELVANMGIDSTTGKIKKTGPVGIKPREFIIDIAFKTTQKYCKNITFMDISNIFNKIDNISKNKLEELIKPLIGAKNLLIKLKNKGIKIAIATTDITLRAKLAMKYLGLIDYFDYIAGADLVGCAKPHPDLVNHIGKALNISKNKIVVVGDAMADFGMAENADVKFIGVTSGLYTDEFISKCELLVDNLKEIEDLV